MRSPVLSAVRAQGALSEDTNRSPALSREKGGADSAAATGASRGAVLVLGAADRKEGCCGLEDSR